MEGRERERGGESGSWGEKDGERGRKMEERKLVKKRRETDSVEARKEEEGKRE